MNDLTKTDFTTTFVVDQTPAEIFNAITNVSGWWSAEISGGTATLHDEFLYRYQDIHRARIKLVEVVPNEKIVWHVLESYFTFTEHETEWTDTTIRFEISTEGKKSKLKFTHVGLTPAYECFEVCQDGWNNYIGSSLRNLITTGKGAPNPKEGGFNATLAEKWNIK